MLRSSTFKACAVIIAAFSAFWVAVGAGIPHDREWAKPGENVGAGEIYIQVNSEAAPLELTTYDGIVMTGIPSLDAVADCFGVYKIEKTFRMESPPTDPNIPDLSRYYVVFFPEGYGPTALMDAYEACSEIVFAEFVTIDREIYIPNDTRYRNQWHLAHCGLPGAWDVTRGSEDVVIGIIDGGLDMNIDGFMTIHEDFQENLWINELEDIDGDGVITFDDFDGRDNDENGYPDDFYGWDFSGRDNWPDDYWGEEGGHGTHVAGIASAVTDNNTGIAGAGFSCKLMTTAHYSLDEPGRNWYGNLGIVYCTDNGADIINLSWGSYGPPNRVNQEAVAYAIGNGVIVFAGAGNDSAYDRSQDRHHFYPCAYDNVIGVGACDQRDNKAYFSNWGDYIDLVTPGVSILSAWPRNSYASHSGTSMASPFAAGMGALLLSVEPDLSVAELLEWMQRTAVDISEVGNNDRYPGIRYRVNADSLLNSTHPHYEMIDLEIIEVQGDGDGYIDRNEVIALAFTLANTEGYTDASNVVISLENDDEYIRIISDEIDIGDIEAGEAHELSEDEYPTFQVRYHSPIHYSTFTLNVTSDEEYIASFDIQLTIRHPMFLLVDDDDGDDFEEKYTLDLMERPIVHDTWSIFSEDLPSQEYLNSYSFVVWETGNDETPLSGAEQELISNYLDQDGYLLLSGQYIGDDIGDTEFHTNYLKAEHVTDDIENPRLYGVDDHPITDGFDVLLIGGGSAGNGRKSPSSMAPIGGAETILTYFDTEDAGGIYYAGDYHLVYLGFALEAVSNSRTPRIEVLQSILDHFYYTDVEGGSDAVYPVSFEMGEPVPNPFNARTTIQVNVPQGANYNLSVVDITGRTVVTLHEGRAMPGFHTHHWNAEEMSTGVYLINLTWQGGSMTRKAVLIR